MLNDYYAELGVTKDVSNQGIRDAYRTKALQIHPDKNPEDPVAAERFRRLTEAYQVLSNPDARRAYDRGYDISSPIIKNARKNVRAAIRAYWRARYGLDDDK